MFSIRMLGLGPLSAGIFTFAADIVDYGEWKTGVRAEGFAFSGNSFGLKLGTGLGSGMVGWFLAMGHYDGNLVDQPYSAISSMIIAAVLIPIICCLLIIFLLAFWNIDKYRPQIEEMLMQKSKEQHAGALGKY